MLVFLFLVVFALADEEYSQWMMLYNGDSCTGAPIWIQRNVIPQPCVPQPCQKGPMGPVLFQCRMPPLTDLCVIKKFDKKKSLDCAWGTYIADGFANVTNCYDWTSKGYGWMKFDLSENRNHLLFNKYDQEYCQGTPSTISDYVMNKCVVDAFGDPDVFIGCMH